MIKITHTPFDPAYEIGQFEKNTSGSGAMVTFLGKVRSVADGAPVTGLYLEHFPGMTEKSIAAIATRAHDRWALEAVLIIHRIGDMAAGEPIVLVCTASAHRRDAFEAADFIMDHLKADALFWKKERRPSGDVWIEPRAQDYNDKTRWQIREKQE